MKIKLNNLAHSNKTINNIVPSEIKNVKVNANVSEALKEIDSVKLNFEQQAQHLTSKEYLLARSYLAQAEMEHLCNVFAKEL